jgi:NADPH2:quinone reductase
VDNLRIGEAPTPSPGATEALIKVHYAGLRWGDIMARNGLPSRARETLFILGQEASDVVEAVDGKVGLLEPGMRVATFPFGG